MDSTRTRFLIAALLLAIGLCLFVAGLSGIQLLGAQGFGRYHYQPADGYLYGGALLAVGLIVLCIDPRRGLDHTGRTLGQRLLYRCFIISSALLALAALIYAALTVKYSLSNAELPLLSIILFNIPTIAAASVAHYIFTIAREGYKNGGKYEDYQAVAKQRPNFFLELLNGPNQKNN